MDFERILQMTTSERNLALLQDEAFVDDVTEFLRNPSVVQCCN